MGGYAQAHKAAVIESNYAVPTAVMTIASGVELIEKGKSTKGEHIVIPNKIKLSEYNKMKDPRMQQVSSNAQAMHARRFGDPDGLRDSREDPYKSFKRSLLLDQRIEQTGRASKESKMRHQHSNQDQYSMREMGITNMSNLESSL